jgi:hypothetical protein
MTKGYCYLSPVKRSFTEGIVRFSYGLDMGGGMVGYGVNRFNRSCVFLCSKAGRSWIRVAEDRARWRAVGEAYVQQWTVVGSCCYYTYMPRYCAIKF